MLVHHDERWHFALFVLLYVYVYCNVQSLVA
jgi:hypothetical protein